MIPDVKKTSHKKILYLAGLHCEIILNRNLTWHFRSGTLFCFFAARL